MPNIYMTTRIKTFHEYHKLFLAKAEAGPLRDHRRDGDHIFRIAHPARESSTTLCGRTGHRGSDRSQARRVRPRSAPVQFVTYVGSVLQGDLGISFRTKRAIVDDLKVFIPATLELVILSMILAIIVGIPVGVISAAIAAPSSIKLAG